MRTASSVVVVSLLLGTLGQTSLVMAQENAADVAAARALGTEGVKLADKGKCEDAVDKLSRAEKLHHAPMLLERLGECQVALGKIVEGTENLQRVVREEMGSNAPAAVLAAKMRAQKVLEAAKPKVAKLIVSVTGVAQADSIVVKLDGQTVSSASLGMERPTDPGDHTLDISAPGYKSVSRKVTLSMGGSESVSVTLEVDPNAKPIDDHKGNGDGGNKGDGRGKDDVVVPPPAQGNGKTIAAVTSLAVGGVGLVLGGVFGVLAMSKKSTLDGQCVAKACPSGTQSTIDAANTFATVSTVGFIVGGVGLAAGIVLLAIPNGAPTAKPVKGLTVTPMLGVTSVGVSGTF